MYFILGTCVKCNHRNFTRGRSYDHVTSSDRFLYYFLKLHKSCRDEVSSKIQIRSITFARLDFRLQRTEAMLMFDVDVRGTSQSCALCDHPYEQSINCATIGSCFIKFQLSYIVCKKYNDGSAIPTLYPTMLQTYEHHKRCRDEAS